MKCKPSEVYFIKDELTAYCFDRAVVTFATHVEAAVEAATDKAKSKNAAQGAAKMVLNKYLYADNSQAPGRFRDPAKR